MQNDKIEFSMYNIHVQIRQSRNIAGLYVCIIIIYFITKKCIIRPSTPPAIKEVCSDLKDIYLRKIRENENYKNCYGLGRYVLLAYIFNSK